MVTILLVDDDPAQLRTREMILSSQGWSVQVATNASSALELLRAGCVGLVISDHHLEGHSGVDLVKELRLLHSTLPVLILTGMPAVEDSYAGLNVTIRFKPLLPDELIQVVKSCISS
jgi:DNA-binding response OmpR family regulator